MIFEHYPIRFKNHILKVALIVLALLYALLLPVQASAATDLEDIKKAMIEYLVCSPVALSSNNPS
jgi:hypothetical protein